MSLPNEPYSRIERYLARLAGQDVDIPDKPITRIECYLDYIVNNGGGIPASNAGAHNSVFRGKSLGATFTADQADSIDAGTFDDLFIGDFWTISEVNYRIAAFDYYFEKGGSDTNPLRKHHAVIVPDTPLYTAAINPTDTIEGGYLGSELKTSGLDRALGTVREAFGSTHIIARSEQLNNTVQNGGPSNWSNTQSYIDLMSEGQVCGRGGFGTQNRNGYNIACSYGRFPLFDKCPRFVSSSSWYWLRDFWGTYWVAITKSGTNNFTVPSVTSVGVRPFFLLGKDS